MLYAKLKCILDDYNNESTDILTDLDNNFQDNSLSNFARTCHVVVAMFNFKTLQSDFISDNLEEILGYKKVHADIPKDQFVKNIASEHSNFPKVLTKIMLDCIGNLDSNNPKISIMSCGLRYNHPSKGVIRLLKKQYISEMDEKGHPERGVFTTQDVTHLIKDDFYWIQLISETDEQVIKMNFRSETGVKHNSSIITPREKEILLLIAQGIESCEIAKTLYISNNTVNNHRQHMLNRLGVKDTTALVSLAKLCELI